MGKDLPQARVVARRDLSDELFVFKLEPPQPLTFRPGQYCTLGLEGIMRPYSIVSAPHEEHIELFVERIPEPEGVLTPRLHRLRVGDNVGVAPKCKGTFLLDESRRHHLLVATVTGIAPFVSYLRDYLYRGRDDLTFTVLMGASYQDELVYADELSRLAAEHPSIRFVPTVSRPGEAPNAGWRGETGRVNSVVGKYLGQCGLLPVDTAIYACGHPDMIADVRERFAPRGYAFHEEKYW